MQSIFGKIYFNRQSVPDDDVKTALTELSLGKKLKQFIQSNKNKGFGTVQFFPSQFSTDFFHPKHDQTSIIIGDCRIDNRDKIINQLKIDNHNISDHELIFQSYKKWKTDCPQFLTGDFSFAIWDDENEALFCARDHFGVKPFNYYIDQDKFIFSSEINGILSQTDINISIDQQYIADTISIIKSEHNRSTYNEIKKLPPAHSLYLKNGQITISKYWTLQPAKLSYKNDDEYLKQFKDLLFTAVKTRLKDQLNYGAELSGGIDSSSITSIASQFVPVKTFSHVLPESLIGQIHPFKDEKKYINLLTNFCKINEKYFITSENIGILDALKNSLTLNRGIVQQNFSVFSDQLYQAANESNIQVLLSGFGGDEVVTSKSANYLSEISRNKQFKTDLKNQNYSSIKIFTLQLKNQFKNYFPKFTGLIIRLIKGEKWWIKKYKNLAVNNSFNDKMSIKSRYLDHYKNIKKDNLVEQSVERITHQHVAQRLEYSSLAAKKQGI
ncbi:MAG: asparagine synthase-related protein, partial [Bacteroidales bacterium]